VRSCIVTLFVVTFMAAAAASTGMARAEETRSQHQEWIRKLETPGGTFPYVLEIESEHSESMSEKAGDAGRDVERTPVMWLEIVVQNMEALLPVEQSLITIVSIRSLDHFNMIDGS
jgi:hypothetical protein